MQRGMVLTSHAVSLSVLEAKVSDQSIIRLLPKVKLMLFTVVVTAVSKKQKQRVIGTSLYILFYVVGK